MRVVLDTNILISACLKPAGLEAHTVKLVVQGTITACASKEVIAEYRQVLMRDKFAGVRAQALHLLDTLEPRIVKVHPTAIVIAAPDPDDNRFLESAVAGQAEFLITGNLRDFPPVYESTKMVNARQFLTARFPALVDSI